MSDIRGFLRQLVQDVICYLNLYRLLTFNFS